MKKVLLFIGFGFMVIAVSLISSCKKDKSGSNSVILANTTPAYVPPQPGSLRINISDLTLHAGDNATIVATLYNSDGTISTTSPSLIWQSSNTAIATVANGLVNAITLGVCVITLTDGIHGILRTNVNVVNANTTISSSPSQIVFDIWPGFMGLRYNMTRTISYTLYDAKGNVVIGIIPTFKAPTNSGLRIVGNTVTAPNFSGFWNILAIIDNDTLPNKLNALVFNSADTMTVISGIPSCPNYFSYYNVSAQALIITVTKGWWDPINGLGLYMFTTSPTKISIDQPAVAILNNGGYITSVGPGNSKVVVDYNGASDEGYIYVDYDFTGSWGGTASNGDSYSFCFSKENPDVFYAYNFYRYDGSGTGGYQMGKYENGLVEIIKNGVVVNVLSNGISLVPSNKMRISTFPDFGGENRPMAHTVDTWFCVFSAGTFLWQTDKNKMKFVDGNNTVVLTRGTGNCGGGGGPTDTTCFANWYVDGVFKYGSGPGNSNVYISSDHSEFYMYFKAQGGDSCSIGGLFFPSKGTYAITQNVEPCAADYWKSGYDHVADVGSLVITEADSNHISGTFNFVDEADPLSVTNGKFKAQVRMYTPSVKSKNKTKVIDHPRLSPSAIQKKS